ncbi:hypothetical protein E4198_07565 [Streptomyces sp. RKND-216]|uniref:hypothetical protein n=1 Tax=Streptomyces sp. RKND-216 TaxID=2562581 RepID=UPI00109E029B|nr:hypothetical protein [Streptomyces sp. RKND-216]THA24623.1 hypothetical protein E4198_07565 [Streptomyces sp. RKND-216]
MISFINTTTTDRSAVSTCLLGSRLRGTGLSGAPVSAVAPFGPGVVEIAGGNERLGAERPTNAPAVAAEAQAAAYALGFAANGAGVGRQKKQHLMWAFRGHEPWRDPA